MICPGFIGSAGFWLSFSAMAGIVFVYPVIRGILRAARPSGRIHDNYIISTIIITISVQLVCGPLLHLLFRGSSPCIAFVKSFHSAVFLFPYPYLILVISNKHNMAAGCRSSTEAGAGNLQGCLRYCRIFLRSQVSVTADGKYHGRRTFYLLLHHICPFPYNKVRLKQKV